MRIFRYTLTVDRLLPALLCGLLGTVTGSELPPIQPLELSEKQAVWSRFLGYGPEAYATQLSTFNQDGSLVFAQQARRLFGIQTDTGEIRWRKNANDYSFTNPATANQNKLFIGTNEPRLLALDSHTGDLIWSTQLPKTTLASVAADQAQVIVKTVSGTIIALDEKNGEVQWQYQHKSPSVTLKTSSAPKLTQDKVWVGFPDGKLLTFDRVTGQCLFEHTVSQPNPGTEFEKLVDIATDPVVDYENATIYVNSYQGKLQCLALANGEVKWERPFKGYRPLILLDNLYCLDNDDVLYAFDKLNGNILWSQAMFKDHKTKYGYQIAGPVLSDKYLVLADQMGTLYWLSLNNGCIVGKASFNIASPILKLPLARDSKVYVINRRSQIAAWHFTDDKVLKVRDTVKIGSESE